MSTAMSVLIPSPESTVIRRVSRTERSEDSLIRSLRRTPPNVCKVLYAWFVRDCSTSTVRRVFRRCLNWVRWSIRLAFKC